MVKVVVAIRDTMTGYYDPSCFVKDEVAVREFFNAFKTHPNKDYMQMWKLGTWDTESGTFIPLPAPELIAKGVDYVERS